MANETYLAHHGILGMRWGVRRWQNKDGSYNAAGKLRYGDGPTKKNTRKTSAKSASSSRKQSSQKQKPKNEAQQPNQPKPVSEMTDQEIRDFLARRDLEAKYMAAITPKQQEKAESLTHKYMVQFGTKLADKIVQDAATQLGASIVRSILGGDKNDKEDKEDKKDKKRDEKIKEPNKKNSQPTISELDRENIRAKAIANDKAAYELERRKAADRAADEAAAQKRAADHTAALRQIEVEEERRRRNVIALPAGK